MKKVFLITLDTEEDNQWDLNSGVSVENIKYLPRFQELAEKYNFKPTWLITYEIASNDNFVEYFKEKQDKGLCEIGMHLHAWNNPPEYELKKVVDARPYLIEYPASIMEKKISELDAILKKKFKKKAVSHRAGRWTTNEQYFDLLEKYNYNIDCSMTPHVNWHSSKGITGIGGSDYQNVPESSFYVRDNLLEIPVTIRKIRTIEFSDFKNIKRMIRSIQYFITGKKQWIRPDKNLSFKGMKKVIDICNENGEYIMFMIHSSELMPGGSPNFVSSKDIEELYSVINRIFQYAKDKGYVGMTLEEYYKYMKRVTKND